VPGSSGVPFIGCHGLEEGPRHAPRRIRSPAWPLASADHWLGGHGVWWHVASRRGRGREFGCLMREVVRRESMTVAVTRQPTTSFASLSLSFSLSLFLSLSLGVHNSRRR
jgi:hypothetical protein